VRHLNNGTSQQHTRALPFSEDAEKAVLSCYVLAPDRIGQACIEKGIEPHYFHLPHHALIFETLRDFWREGDPIDFVTITQWLRDLGRIEEAGGAHYISDLFTYLPTAANAANYIETVTEKYVLRQIIAITTDYGSKAYDHQDNPFGLLSQSVDAMLKLVKIAEGRRIHSRTMRELVIRAIDRLHEAIEGDGTIEMPYGIQQLDFETQGMRAPELTVIAGKSSDGKTCLALNVAETIGITHKLPVGIISLEMSDDQLTERLLAAHAWVDIKAAKRARSITPEESARVTKAADRIATSPIYIRDDGQLSSDEIAATFATWKANHGLRLGIIDHAQLIRPSGGLGRTEQMEQISRSLKPMAKRLGIPLIVLSQVSKDGDDYKTKNSMALTEDADNLLTISHHEGKSWIHISKQRDGARNVPIPVTFIQHLQRFKSREEEQPELVDMGKKKKGGR